MDPAKQIAWILTIVLAFAGVGLANWADSFDDGQLNLTTWQFLSYPQVTGTFTYPIQTSPDGNSYLALAETSSTAVGGTAFGMGLGSAEEFADVRIGAVVNVTGDASHNHHGLGARAGYIIDPDGSLTGGAPGAVVSAYVMHVNWEDGPANLRIDIEKVVQLQNIMRTNFEVVVPQLANARSYYAELDVVGAGPVCVTGSLYEYKGGPLVARTPTMVDTTANDPWEDPGKRDAPFVKGASGIFAQNEHSEPVGFYTTFDDVFSVSDGPAVAAIVPADGATNVSITTDLNWIEAGFATGRQLWFGPEGEMELIEPAPTDGTCHPGMLEADQTYQWRVDEVGPGGVVPGPTWEFTTGRTIGGGDSAVVSLSFRGRKDNVPQPLYLRLEDAAGNKATVVHPVDYAVQSEPWRTWEIRLTEFTGVDPNTVAKLTIGTGADADSGQGEGDDDVLYLDNICLSVVSRTPVY